MKFPLTINHLSAAVPLAGPLLNHLVDNVLPMVDNFQLPTNEAEYAAILAECNNIRTQMAAFNRPRVLFCAADGTVVVDTGVTTAFNNFAKFGLKEVAENHNSRAAIMCAQLSLFGHGLGVEAKYSTSTKSNQIYAASIVNGKRFNNVGTIRISFTATA